MHRNSRPRQYSNNAGSLTEGRMVKFAETSRGILLDQSREFEARL